jgi:hypothetical protein
MKNIHILPTDKPSRYWMTRLGNLTRCHDIKPIKEALGNNVNIYITSNEEIKKGDWVLYTNGIKIHCQKIDNKEDVELANIENSGVLKIIVTTDQDLIKDGVQAIDDDFLEWFVKNSGCEEVEVVRDSKQSINSRGFTHILWLDYKIIIPKEEPKQELSIRLKNSLYQFNINLDEALNLSYWKLKTIGFSNRTIQELQVLKQEPKQETLYKLKIIEQGVYYQVMITNEEGKQLAFKQDDKWTINVTTEEILDSIFKSIYNI